MTPEEEIRQREQGRESGAERSEGQTGNTPATPQDASDGVLSSVSFSLSRRQAILLATVVAVAVLLWWLRSRSESEPSAIEAVREADLEGGVDAESDGDDGEEIHVPQDPSDPLAADSAVLQALKANGTITGGK